MSKIFSFLAILVGFVVPTQVLAVDNYGHSAQRRAVAIESTQNLDSTVSSQATTSPAPLDDTAPTGTLTPAQRIANLEAQKALLIQRKENFAATKCAKIEARVQMQITRYEENLKRKAAWHHRFYQRLEKLIAKMKERGYDTTKPSADLVELDKLLNKFIADKEAYMVLLKETKTYTCSKTEGEFRSKLLDTKEALNTVRESYQAIKYFYLNTIKPDILALKEQAPTTPPTPETPATTTPAEQPSSDGNASSN